MILSSFTSCFCIKICCLKKKIYDDIFIYSVTQKQHSSVKTTAGHLSESAKFGTTLREKEIYTTTTYLCATVGKRGTGWVRSLHVSQLFALIVHTSLTFCATALVWEMLQGNKSAKHKPTQYVYISEILIVEKRFNHTRYFQYSKRFLGQLVFMGYQTKQKKTSRRRLRKPSTDQ